MHNAPDHTSAPREFPSVRVGGMAVTTFSIRDWVDSHIACALARRAGRGKSEPYYFTSANGNVLSLYARDARFRELIDRSDGVEADGKPIVLASRWTKTPIRGRTATTDFYHLLADAGAADGISYYLLGARPEMNQAAIARSRAAHPALIISGRDGYFSHAEEDRVVAEINAAKPDVLWIGLGVPLEQEFVERNRHKLVNVGVIRTCGGMFDFIAGKNQRAPKWMQDLALEWAYRVWLEPRRLFWRYATTNVHALWLLLARTGDSARR